MAHCKLFVVATMALLLTFNLFSEQVSAQYQDCCMSYSKKALPCPRIRGYSIQSVKDLCNIEAVVFHTIRGKNICADPSQEWVMDRIACLNNRVKRMA
ncbi:C-C motif chemokine 20-like [Polyodon spathula]|uniref:C-C motif chemokine 20-like n=1 Tax=Polyodon spathula TaxID=7913 RepID=UPI001B7EB12B|nr:C-C motif chemokine 20-like [Polyodon spathula]